MIIHESNKNMVEKEVRNYNQIFLLGMLHLEEVGLLMLG